MFPKLFGRQKVATLAAEFLGTGVLTLVFLSVQRSTIGIPYFISLAAGAAVAVAAFYFSDSSSAHLNPAITLALWTARKVGTLVAVVYIVAQMLGAWAAYAVYHYFVNTTLQPIGGHYSARVLLAEAVGTLVLGLAWGAAAFKRYEGTNRALLLGAAYTLAIIIASAAGLGVANPAVAEGIRAWAVFGSMGWGTYLLGPVLGAIIGVNLYALLFSVSEESDLVETVIVAETVTAAPATSRSKTTTSRSRTGARRTSSTPAKRGTSSRSTTTRRAGGSGTRRR